MLCFVECIVQLVGPPKFTFLELSRKYGSVTVGIKPRQLVSPLPPGFYAHNIVGEIYVESSEWHVAFWQHPVHYVYHVQRL